MDTFFRLEVYGKVQISLVEVYERVKRPKSTFYGCENNKKLPGVLI